MHENRFFRFVWRINAIMLLAAGLLGWGLAAREKWEEMTPMARSSSERPSRVTTEEALVLSRPQRLGDSDWFEVPLAPGGRVSDCGRTHVRNILLVNGRTNDSRWLFEDDTMLIADWSSRGFAYGDVTEQPSVGVYEVIREDTDGDGELDYGDRRDLLVMDPASGRRRWLLTGLVGGATCEFLGDRLFVWFTTAEGRGTAVFALGEGFECVGQRILRRSDDPVSPAGA